MIEVKHDGSDSLSPPEHCCFCARPTRFWFEPKDVAVCRPCAAIHVAEEVPTKIEWFEKSATEERP